MEDKILSGGRRLKDALTLSSIYFSGYRSLKKGENNFNGEQFLTVIFSESGNFTLKYQGINLFVPESNLVFIPPQTSYTLLCDLLKARVFVCEFSLSSRVPVDIDGQLFFASGIKLPLLKRLIRSSLSIFPNGTHQTLAEKVNPLDEHLVKNCAELLLIDCIKSTDKLIIDKNYPISGKGESAKTAIKVYEYLAQNLDRNVTLEEIADELFFSVSYVKTAFKKHTGTTIIKAFTSMKIDVAKKLIKKGMSFSKIANELAFSSSQYFSKTFTKETGCTPMEYKKSLSK